MTIETDEILVELIETDEILARLWDEYADAGYEKAYWTHSTKDARAKLSKLFRESKKGKILDAGCGTGAFFKLIIKKIRPTELWAVDLSARMLKKAQKMAEMIRNQSDVLFKLLQNDLLEPLPFADNFFDATVSSLVICYIARGWQCPIRELYRVTKQGGYLYLSTFLNTWDFSTAIRFAPREFLKSPIGTLYGIKFKNIVQQIAKEATKKGAKYPSCDELMSFFADIGFKEIKTSPIYWGHGVALRARKI